jgi:hypothetical protein
MGSPSRRWHFVVCAFLSASALAGAVICYWRSLADETGVIRQVIPTTEMKAAGAAVIWHVPSTLRAERWHRTGVVIWEGGKALPLRVQSARMATGQSDNSSPLSNGRTYEFELDRTTIRDAALMGGLLILATAFLFAAMITNTGRRSVTNRQAGFISFQLAAPRARIWKLRGLAFLACGVLCWVLSARTAFYRRIAIPSGMITQHDEGYFVYNPPRWVRNHFDSPDSIALLEEGKPLERVSFEILRLSENRGVYAIANGQICFQPSGAMGLGVLHRAYFVKVLATPAKSMTLAAIVFAIPGLFFLHRVISSDPRDPQRKPE